MIKLWGKYTQTTTPLPSPPPPKKKKKKKNYWSSQCAPQTTKFVNVPPMIKIPFIIYLFYKNLKIILKKKKKRKEKKSLVLLVMKFVSCPKTKFLNFHELPQSNYTPKITEFANKPYFWLKCYTTYNHVFIILVFLATSTKI